MSADGAARRFPTTPGGAIRRGRRRLAALLLGLSLLLVLVALAAFAGGRRWPALLALLVALVPWTAWRMSGDLEPLWLEVEGPWLVLQMRRRRERRELAGAEARRLTPEETAHLTRLATAGGVVAGTGGFDSHLLGEVDLAASDLAHAVLLDWGESRLIVTPDDPAAFLLALSNHGLPSTAVPGEQSASGPMAQLGPEDGPPGGEGGGRAPGGRPQGTRTGP